MRTWGVLCHRSVAATRADVAHEVGRLHETENESPWVRLYVAFWLDSAALRSSSIRGWRSIPRAVDKSYS
jgi:hypothetical protein